MRKAWRVSNDKNYLQWIITQTLSKKGNKKIEKRNKRDIAIIYEKIKKSKNNRKKYKKKDWKYMSIGRGLSIIEDTDRLINEKN